MHRRRVTQARWVHEDARRVVHAAPSPHSGLPWGKALAAHWLEQLGDVPEAEEIITLLERSLAPGTSANYGNHVARFVRWCASRPDRPQPLPASTATVVRWLVADVVRGDRVKAGSLQPYLSAINRFHRDFEKDEPALGHLIQQVRRGVALRQADSGRDSQRVYLPPTEVERAHLHVLREGRATSPKLLRAVVAVVLSYCLFVRGGTGAALCEAHVRRSAAGITVTLDHEKGKRVAGVARVLTFSPGAIPGLEELLDLWEDVRGPVPDGHCYFAFARESASFPATQIDTWLQQVLSHFGVQPPAGETWSGHSLRKGAASGAAAIDVALHKICYMGGWSIKSRAVFDYIDPTCPRPPACRRYFGWLAPQ